ncbi:MAG TPA: hypothetical protein VK742_10265 [Candidatus Sulfotelmatobacter sp.]|jgi:hypothetical protein|nr:hypothetical protein [Candidatus Sulfotelmatobacter sp.]
MSDEIVNAINDLTRVTVAISGGFTSQAEAVRKLAALSIPSGRIASILAMKQSDVASIVAKSKKKGSK